MDCAGEGGYSMKEKAEDFMKEKEGVFCRRKRMACVGDRGRFMYEKEMASVGEGG
jgi:hypothetical protein